MVYLPFLSGYEKLQIIQLFEPVYHIPYGKASRKAKTAKRGCRFAVG
jgi:hypothetical protein